MHNGHRAPSETLVMDRNEHDDQVGDPGADDAAPVTIDDTTYAVPVRQPRTGVRLGVTASRPRGAFSVALAPQWRAPGPLRSVMHGASVDEETIAHLWAARLCFLDNPQRTAFREPEAPRMYRSVELALPADGGNTGKHAYTYPLILRFTDPDAAQALADDLTALAAALRRTAPDPFGGCVDCVKSVNGVCFSCAGGDEPA